MAVRMSSTVRTGMAGSRLSIPATLRSSFKLHVGIRHQATDASPPALLSRLRSDLKTAMREKDKARLNVIKAILNGVTSAAKTSSPIKSDMQLLSLIRKKVAASGVASKAFGDAGRQDLKDLEDAEIAILNEYAGGVEVMGEDKIEPIVARVIEQERAAGNKPSVGDVLKNLIGSGGALEGQSVEKALVARLVKAKLAS